MLYLKLHTSYKSLGKEFKITFDEFVKHLNQQQIEANNLRRQILDAGVALTDANKEASLSLAKVIAEEKNRATEERTNLINQITSLIQSQGEAQEKRLDARVVSIQEQIGLSNEAYHQQHERYDTSMDTWSGKETTLVENVHKSCENVKSKIKKDWTVSLASQEWYILANIFRRQTNKIRLFKQLRDLFMPRPSALSMLK